MILMIINLNLEKLLINLFYLLLNTVKNSISYQKQDIYVNKERSTEGAILKLVFCNFWITIGKLIKFCAFVFYRTKYLEKLGDRSSSNFLSLGVNGR